MPAGRLHKRLSRGSAGVMQAVNRSREQWQRLHDVTYVSRTMAACSTRHKASWVQEVRGRWDAGRVTRRGPCYPHMNSQKEPCVCTGLQLVIWLPTGQGDEFLHSPCVRSNRSLNNQVDGGQMCKPSFSGPEEMKERGPEWSPWGRMRCGDTFYLGKCLDLRTQTRCTQPPT